MIEVPYDLILHISSFMKLKDILDFSITCKELYRHFDNLFYKNLAYQMYGICFWLKANCIPQSYSKPLCKFKLEIIRIENFQRHLDNLNVSRWTKKDFYNYWKYDKFIS